MQLNIGTKIKELRRRDGRTQEALAEALGVTNQAVSRWESGGSYPDMEIVPAIANYFHVSIDELFGYQNDREERIKRVLEEAKHRIQLQGHVLEKDCGDYEGIVQMLREASEEFPSEPEIMYQLANALHRLGWQKFGGRHHSTGKNPDYIDNDVEYNAQNIYWQEALQVLERLLKLDISSDQRGKAVFTAAMIYPMIGQYEKAQALVNKQDSIFYCQEMLLPRITEGEEMDKVQGESIIACLLGLEWVLSYAVVSIRPLCFTPYSRSILLAVAELYELIFSDGRCGRVHWNICELYLRLARYEALDGNLQKAMDYFDKAFTNDKLYREACTLGDYHYSAPLVSKVVESADKFTVRSDHYWEEVFRILPERLVTEIRQNPKYAECFA